MDESGARHVPRWASRPTGHLLVASSVASSKGILLSIDTATAANERTSNARIAPSVPVALGVFIAYVLVFIGLSSSSGIAYGDWFASGENAFRTAVVPLIGGSLVLIIFLLWARWDFVFKDSARLPMYGILTVGVVLFAVGIVVHLTGVNWGGPSGGLIAAIIATGVLVGFAEETLFRGIILRSLRTKMRAEFWIMLWSSLWFGFFHATNLANGSPLGPVLGQCVLASAAGVLLYSARRWRGLLLAGMIAHGLWDMSVFLPATDTGVIANLFVQVLVVIVAVIAVIVMLRKDRSFAVTEDGLQTL